MSKNNVRSNGKGSRARNNSSKFFYENYEQINWGQKPKLICFKKKSYFDHESGQDILNSYQLPLEALRDTH